MNPRLRLLFALLAAASLTLAGWELMGAELRGGSSTVCDQGTDPKRVEEAYAPLLADLQSGRKDETLLELRRRADKGPFPGAASYLLGEMAYADGSPGAALRHYRAGVEREPVLADRGAPFGASATMTARMAEIRRSGWAAGNPPEMGDLHFLMRRLAGGCQ